MNNAPYRYIKTRTELIAYVQSLEEKKCRAIALDIEGENNLHAYGEQLCLAQVYDGEDKVIVDPLEIDTHCLKLLFENRDILKIMYDASSDSSMLKNTRDIVLKSVLDLRPAVELLALNGQNLHSVIAAELGVTLTQKTKFQRYNWTKRPISPEALDYAVNDVYYLFRLKDTLLKKIWEAGLLETYILRNIQVQNKDYYRDPLDKYRKTKGYHALSTHDKTVFKKLFDIRESYAKKYNLPAFNIVSNHDLLSLAVDAGHIHNIKFHRHLRDSLMQGIMEEMRGVGR